MTAPDGVVHAKTEAGPQAIAKFRVPIPRGGGSGRLQRRRSPKPSGAPSGKTADRRRTDRPPAPFREAT